MKKKMMMNNQEWKEEKMTGRKKKEKMTGRKKEKSDEWLLMDSDIQKEWMGKTEKKIRMRRKEKRQKIEERERETSTLSLSPLMRRSSKVQRFQVTS